ncbi:TonB-dependent receptor [Pelomonas sp. CA6]|uniref:TonB-dependent receptor domain-containing protein n=1 Tax=Pelomonas sp. CA6 TaxID=2907999 RepID=UPI001F4C2211|nr:TonB-dependent receptor [Pelomonas sp. CA6]MCH7343918.1 TonB-dependent receptor [Pelomonas sp. CA6]
MFKKTLICQGVLLALGAGMMLPAQAQQQQQQQQLERVEVTGSSIKRLDSETSLPVQVINRAEIARTGAQSVTELIQNLPAIQGFTQASQSVGGGGGGFSGASVHSIGETRTLVLLNGRRVATWAGQTLTGSGAAIDLNSIPLSAIERVELLTDGASAVYGTDAIAGVVNFILRKDLTTGEASLNYSSPRGSVGQNTTASFVKGFGDVAKDGYNAMVAFSADRQKRMKATDRSFAKTGVIPFSNNGTNYIFFNGSIRSVPANYETYNGTTGRDVLGNPYYDKNGKCPEDHVYRGGACRFDYTTTIEILPESQRDSVFGSFTKALGEHTLSLDVAYNRFTLTSRIAPPPVDMLIPVGTALYNKYMPGGTNVLDPGSTYGDDLYAYWRGMDVGNRVTQDRTTALHTAISLTGTLGGWDYASAFTHSQNKWVESHLGGWLLQKEQDAAIQSGAFDPFLAPGQQSTAGQQALAGMQHRGVFKTEKSTLDAFEFRASREVFKLGDRAVQVGTGFDLRRERVKYDPSDVAKGIVNNIAGDSSQEVPYDVKRNIWGVYGEVLVPLAKQFEVNGSLRYDHYDDFGNTTNAKLSARFQPSKEMLFRASVGTGFRAPSVPQVSAGRQLYGVSGNTYNCPTAAETALKAIDPLAKCRPSGSQYEVLASGTPDLKPEKSLQWTLGARFEPLPSLSVGADIWAVNIKDRISQLSEEVAMADPAKYLKNFSIFVDPGTKNHYVALYLPNENMGKERYRGVDVDAKVNFNMGIGRLTSSLNWTHLFSYDYQRIKDGPWFSNLGAYNDGAVTFRNILRLTNVLKTGALENTLTLNYKSGYLDQPCDAANCGLVRLAKPDGTAGAVVDMLDHRVSSYTTVDWQGRYEFNKALTFTLGVFNVFDRNPPLSLKTSGGHQLGYDNRYTDARGRTLYLGVQGRF